MFTEKQRGVLHGMLGAVGATLLALAVAVTVPPAAVLPEHDFPAALVQALKWDVLLVACLAVNIAMLARHRFFTPEDIDGGGLSKGMAQAQLLQSTLQNTLEQVILALSLHMIWATAMPWSWQAAVPTAAILFLVGRVLFWRGYPSWSTLAGVWIRADVLPVCRDASPGTVSFGMEHSVVMGSNRDKCRIIPYARHGGSSARRSVAQQRAQRRCWVPVALRATAPAASNAIRYAL